MRVKMKQISCLMLMLLLVFPALAQAEEFTADSKISSVTVYTNRAAVTRTAKIKLPQGAHTVVFRGLPDRIATDSLRVEGSAKADVVIGALAHKRVVTQELTSEKERMLSDNLQKLADQIGFEKAEIKALNNRLQLMDAIKIHALQQINEEIKSFTLQPLQWISAAKKMQEEAAAVKQAQQRHDINIRDLNEAVQKVKRELSSLRTGSRSSYEVTVPLEAMAATELELDLTYQSGNASWQPIYDARLDTESGELVLVQYGAVRQLSGEDWQNVALTLSTARPHRSAALPPLNPIWVNSHEVTKANLNGATAVGFAFSRESEMLQEYQKADVPMASMPMKQAVVERKAQFAAAQVDTGGFVAEYRVPNMVTVLSDNEETKLMVGAFDVENKLEIHIQPQHLAEAFLVAHGKLKSEAPVLPGQVNLFRDGAYVGKTRIPLLRPEEEHNLFFGVDDSLSVKRNTLKDERKDDGLIVKEASLERHYITEIKNLRKTAVDIHVRETVPVSKDDEIKIEILRDKTTQGYETDIDKIVGLTGWSFSLAPEEKKDIRLGWKVIWPQEDRITGLP
ncbi:MAG: mucoidy inhibitor MuiA family protein [Alphaproteobacteria bacterium]|nr:MAG: mucoidy inhibitor MuiA family protein [Alphaproteobacteria bacterium]